MMASMNAVLIDPPAWFVERRKEMGGDRWDEVWEGVQHMAPQPTYDHQGIGSELVALLVPLVKERGWHVRYETSLYDPDRGESDYRVPDVMVVDPAHASERGVEGRAELVVEILSPGDESRAKLPFYARRQRAVAGLRARARDRRGAEAAHKLGRRQRPALRQI